jgi:hypothetical protein
MNSNQIQIESPVSKSNPSRVNLIWIYLLTSLSEAAQPWEQALEYGSQVRLCRLRSSSWSEDHDHSRKDLSAGLQGYACPFEVRSSLLPTVAKTGSSCGTVFGGVPHRHKCEELGHGMQLIGLTGCPIAYNVVS